MGLAATSGGDSDRGRPSFEVKYGAQRDVDLREFIWVQAAREFAEALRIDGGGLFDQHPDMLADELDRGMDHGSEGLRCRGGYEPRREVVVGVGLDDDGIALALLLVSLS